MPEFGESLSSREMDVLECIIEGATNKEIADRLTISENTVKVHLRRIYTKLGVSTRTEATTVAIQQGLVSVPGVEVVSDDDEPQPEPEPEPEAAQPTAVSPQPAAPPTLSAAPAPLARGTDWRTVSLVLLVILAAIVAEDRRH